MTPSNWSSTTVLLLALSRLPSVAIGFLQPPAPRVSLFCSGPPRTVGDSLSLTRAQRITKFFMTSDDDDDGDDEEEDAIDPNSLGDWRKFRMNLANSGLSTPESSGSSTIDGIDLGGGETKDASSSSPAAASEAATTTSTTTTTASSSSRPKSVSKRNERLLDSQNAALAEEYLTGAWAHESPVPEAGGLVCRMPLEAEIYRGDPGSAVHGRLRKFLESEDYGRMEDSVPTSSLRSSASTGGAASASSVSDGSDRARGIISQSNDSAGGDEEEDDDADAGSSFSALAAQTVFWYRGAEKLLKRELVEITTRANDNGRIDADSLDQSSLELLKMYMDHQQTWQEVSLVLEKDERRGTAKTVTINRPMAFKLSESMGRLVLMGAYHAEKGGGAINRREGNGSQTQNLVKFLGAFENQCGVYVGGPDDMDKPAVMIHGVDDLPGAVEISPGTGIYEGGLEAAMDGVMSGKYKPLDFRFFIGHTKYEGGRLDEAVGLGKYQPVACSRPLVLKQCIQLPKPLWHEVLEFCGGELKEISKLELAKRDDLR